MYRIQFSLKSNSNELFVNTITLRLQTGQIICVDRHYTDYTVDPVDNTVIRMTWREVHEWTGTRELPLPSPLELEMCELVEFEIEDDAPEDYICEVVGYEIFDDNYEPVHAGGIDLEYKQKRIRMYLLDDDDEFYEKYFTNRIEWDTPILKKYEFDTPEEFLSVWQDLKEDPISMWYWVYDRDTVICSGAIDPGDIDIYEEAWKEEL